MAQIKDKITIEKLLGGWGDTKYTPTLSTAIEGLPGQYSFSNGITFARPGFEGHVSPGWGIAASNTVTDTFGVVDALPLNGVVDSNTNAFIVTSSSKLVYFPILTNIVASGAGHTIVASGVHSTHTAFTGTNSDIAYYNYQNGTSPINTTANYIFWSWEDNVDADVAKLDSTGVFSYTDNYLSGLTGSNGTALARGVPHPLLVGQDQNLYVGNGRYLAKHDPTTTTVDYQALDLKPGWIITGLEKYKNYVALLGYKTNSFQSGYVKSETKLFLWDGFSPSWNFEYDIKDNYARGIIHDGDDLYVISFGRNATVKLKKFNGAGFDILYETAQAGVTPNMGGIDLFLNHIVWGASASSALVGYGSPQRNIPEIGVNAVSGFHFLAVLGTIGMVKALSQNALYVGDVSGNALIRYFDTGSSATPLYQPSTLLRTLLYNLPTNSTIDAIKLYFSQFGTGASVTCKLYKDYDTATDLLNTQITNALEGSISYYPIQNKGITNVNAFYMTFLFDHANASNTAAIIRKVEVEYSYDDGNI